MSRRMLALAVLLLPAALRVVPLRAQHDTMLMGTTPGPSLPLGVASARPGSGTSWLPDSSRVPMFHASIAGWTVMVHGALFAQYDTQTTVHGGRQFGLVDWEMATLGDPLTDVGLLVVYQDLAAQGDAVMPRMTPEQGFLTSPQLVQRYAASSSRSLDALDWYVGFGYFKLAVVAEGIHHRFLAGKTVGEGFSHFGEAVPVLLGAALQRLGN